MAYMLSDDLTALPVASLHFRLCAVVARGAYINTTSAHASVRAAGENFMGQDCRASAFTVARESQLQPAAVEMGAGPGASGRAAVYSFVRLCE